MGQVELVTPCKINIHLGIHSERDSRGYHRVDSVMVPVALFDTVEVSEASELSVCHSPALEVPPEKTTVWRAATLLAEVIGCEPNVCITVKTQIPERAGLGGSSADAGAALRALSVLWGLDPLDERVVGVARRVGADVAFFLNPIPGLYLGAGDILERSFKSFEVPLALVMPYSDGGSTKETYAAFDENPIEPRDYARACQVLESRDDEVIATTIASATEGLPPENNKAFVNVLANVLYNNLAPAAKSLNPEIAEVEDWLKQQSGVLGAQVTGSGACSFAICKSRDVAQRIAQDAQQLHRWRAWATTTVGSSAQVC